VSSHVANLVARARGEGPVVQPFAASVYGRWADPVDLPEEGVERSPDSTAAPASRTSAERAAARRGEPAVAAREARGDERPAPTRREAEAGRPPDEDEQSQRPARETRSPRTGQAAVPSPAVAASRPPGPRRPAQPAGSEATEVVEPQARRRETRTAAPGDPAPAAPVGAAPRRPSSRSEPPPTAQRTATQGGSEASDRASSADEPPPAASGPRSSRPERDLARAPERPQAGSEPEEADRPDVRTSLGELSVRPGRVAPAAVAVRQRALLPGGRRQAAAEAAPVRVSIGRVEVRAAQPPPPPPPAPVPARSSQSLDDYLRERDRSLEP